MGLIFRTDLAVLFPAMILLFAAANLSGAFVGTKRHGLSDTTPAALLGLLALLLGFSFSMVVSRFDNRRAIVLKEANAIGTAFLRAGAIQDPAATGIRKDLREYVDVRLEFYNAGADLDRIQKAIDRSGQLEKHFWAAAETVAQRNSTAVTGLLLSSLNEVIDVDAERVDALRNHLPENLFVLLIVVACCALFSLGVIEGWKGTYPWLWKFLLPMLMAIVFITLADLDRPRRGIFGVDQGSMIALKKTLDTY